MSLIVTVILFAEITITAIIFWFGCEFLLPDRAKRICQLFVALITILAALKATV